MAAWWADSRCDRGYHLHDRAWEKGTMFLEIVTSVERVSPGATVEPPVSYLALLLSKWYGFESASRSLAIKVCPRFCPALDQTRYPAQPP